MGKRRREDWGDGPRDPRQYNQWVDRIDKDRERRAERRVRRLQERAEEVAQEAGARGAARPALPRAPVPEILSDGECRALGVPLGTERASGPELAGSLAQVHARRAAATDARFGRPRATRKRVKEALPRTKRYIRTANRIFLRFALGCWPKTPPSVTGCLGPCPRIRRWRNLSSTQRFDSITRL